MLFKSRNAAFHALAAAAACIVSAVPSARARAQAPHDDSKEMEHPEVRTVEFHGVKSVKLGELREALSTQPSHCLSLLFRPVCLFSKSPYFYERRYFDPLEFRRDVLRVLVFYYRRGWRDAQVDTTVARDGNEVRVRFDVVEGPPTIVDTVVVSGLQGVMRQRRGRRAQQRRSGLRPGEPLNMLKLDTAVARIRTGLLDRGYGNAVVEAPKIDEDTTAHRARVTIATRPGPLTPIARIDVVRLSSKKAVSDETIRNSLTFEPGQLLRRRRLAESQRALYESGLFRSALIDTAVATGPATGRTVCAQQAAGAPTRAAPAAAAAGQGASAPHDSTKNVVVCVLEGQLHDARVSAGFTTADFFALQANYTDNYWLGGPRRLSINASVGNLGAQQLNGTKPFFDVFSTLPAGAARESRYLAPTFQLGANVQQRWFRSPRNTLGGGVFGQRRSSPGIFVDRGYGANLAFTRELTTQVPLSATYRFEINRVEAGEVYFCVNFGACDFPTIDALQGQQRLSPAALTGSISTADNPLEPTSGWLGRLELEHASRVTLSDYRYNRVFGSGSTYLRLGWRRSVLAFRAQAGWVKALASTNQAVGVSGGDPVLHPSKRMYAGGSQSVRGFGENELGPRVLTVDPNLILGRKIEKGDTTYACGGGGVTPAVLRSCFQQRGDSISDRDFIERPLGGTTLALGSVELRVPVWGPLLAAVFVDGAILGEKALSELGKGTGAITPGVGVRYLSPVGPVRVDIGYKPKLTERLPVFTQLDSLGTRRLIDLTANRGCSSGNTAGCRAFPLRESASALRRTLDRLTLHLSIGEAF
ncbi:surface antigen (D15) [Gemmatirosa kalamazoonensis]|uniref:Surface antigen (D15) n=1 Tax=Gemmatirosa kalamazoonensis TaxID=861299 RepID=W0RHS2_9BACT|nr:BamA/TamA family outer membrane protein [Gemmatirosa kalamazoonensis]AHG89875.1 surface antigen (D15) [Gemmatirosa kalamazoonensis]